MTSCELCARDIDDRDKLCQVCICVEESGYCLMPDYTHGELCSGLTFIRQDWFFEPNRNVDLRLKTLFSDLHVINGQFPPGEHHLDPVPIEPGLKLCGRCNHLHGGGFLCANCSAIQEGRLCLISKNGYFKLCETALSIRDDGYTDKNMGLIQEAMSILSAASPRKKA